MRRERSQPSRTAGPAYLGLPLHPCHGDAQQQDDRDGADDPDVVDVVRHEGVSALSQRSRAFLSPVSSNHPPPPETPSQTYNKKLHHCFSKTHDVHGDSDGVGEGEDQADGAAELWAQTPGNQVIGSAWNGKVKEGRSQEPSTLANQREPDRRLPPRTNPLVAIAEVDRPVMVVTTVAMRTITQERAGKEQHTFSLT